MQTATSIHTELFFIGGGHTHAIVLRKIGMQGLPAGVRLTLITNLVDTPYSGMLPCHISGLYDFDQSHIDLRPLTRFANCRLIMDEVVGIDADQQLIHCRHHPPMKYDALSIDIGSTPGTVSVPGAKEYAIPAKPVPNLLQAWQRYLQGLERTSTATIGIVGGGVGGVELALNMQMRLQQIVGAAANIHVFHRGARLATGRSRATQRQLTKIFRDRTIHTHLSESVCAVEPVAGAVQVRCESGLRVACDRVFWVTNASAAPWLTHTGLSTDKDGFILVKDTLQTLSHPNVFAVGDVATMINHPRPKAGVFAVRQGPPLYTNLQRYCSGRPLKPFKPQRQFLNIIDLGTGGAIASRGRWSAESVWFRRWKHQIAGKFMGLFERFPAMTNRSAKAPDTEATLLHCAGCGSKVGSSVLNRALKQALNHTRAELPAVDHWSNPVKIGLAPPDDAAVVAIPDGILSVQTVDQFRAIVDDPYIFAQICVNHCLSDLFAMGAIPQTVLALATLPYGTDAIQTETLYQLMAGTYRALAPSQTWLVGGHTTEGPALSLGFACNGWISPSDVLDKQNLRPGLGLILTKPLGTGVLFAADMQRAAKGRWIEAAIASMVQSKKVAAKCIQAHGVVACTDITGFGLLGHLYEMLRPGLAVELTLEALPVLSGVHACFESGYRSSLHQRNQKIEHQIHPLQSHHPNYPLLFDPQTSGGLLAAVPHAQLNDCLAALTAQGYRHSRYIGDIVPAADGQAAFTIRG